MYLKVLISLEKKVITVERLNDKYCEVQHKTGLKIVVFRTQGYSTSYAILGVNYGSANNRFIDKNGKLLDTPLGIAHFLEHKMFENEDKTDTFELFAKTGASANAFTDFEKTAYLFSGAGYLEDNLKILLNFVTHPYFTKETVQKEQGIIAQEIKMYEDSPSWQVFFNAISAMYQKHPIANDIAGTVDSIATITPELLYTCYDSFYSLNNMILTVVGDVNEEKVINLVDKLLSDCKVENQIANAKTYYEIEPTAVKTHRISKTLPISITLAEIGFKENAYTLQENFLRQFIYEIVLDMIFGSTSKFFEEVYKEGLVTESIDTDVMWGVGYLALLISMETNEPDELYKMIIEEIKQQREHGLNREDFELCKKSLLSRLIKTTENLDDFALLLFDITRVGYDLDFVFKFIENISFKDAEQLMHEGFKQERSVLSVVQANR